MIMKGLVVMCYVKKIVASIKYFLFSTSTRRRRRKNGWMLGCNVYKPETYVYLVDHALSKKLKNYQIMHS